MASRTGDRGRVAVAILGWASLFVAGIVLAVSWAVDFPDTVLNAAWLIALIAMATVLATAYRDARATGTSFLAAVGKSLRALGRFIVAFF